MTGAPIPELTPAQRWFLERCDDRDFCRKPVGVTGRVVARMKELGLVDAKRERGRLGSGVMLTKVRRTARGREALDLPPLNPSGES